MQASELKRKIREIPDFPRNGVVFYDLSTLFRDGAAFRAVIERMVERFQGDAIDALAAIEARGFLLASAMAYRLQLGMILVRKAGKLPSDTESEHYDLEYGTGCIEIHRDAVVVGQRIVIVDDLLATGGTASAAARLIGRLGGRVEGYAFLVELGALGGRGRLGGGNVFSLVHYP